MPLRVSAPFRAVAMLRRRLAAAVQDSPQPVLAPYRAQPGRFHMGMRRLLLLLVLLAIGWIYGFFYAVLGVAFLMFMLAPIVFVMLAVIWALPQNDRVPVVALERFYWCFFVSLFIWPNYLAISIPGLPWMTVSRLFGAPLLLLLLVCASISTSFRERLGRALTTSPAMIKLLVGFLVAQAASVLFSSNPVAAINRLINNQFAWTTVFFVSIFVFLKPGRISLWVCTFCSMAIALSLLGLIEFQVEHVLWANSIPNLLRIDDPAVLHALTPKFHATGYRILATFMSPLSLAEFLALASPFLIHIIVVTEHPLKRLACIAADLLILTAIVLTQARLGLVGFTLSHSVYAAYWAIRRWRTDATSIIGPALTLAYPAILALIGLVIMSSGTLRLRILGGGVHQSSNDAREAQFEGAGAVFLRSPLFGHGPGEGAGALGYGGEDGFISIDSYLLSMSLDYGIVGFICVFGMLSLAFYKAAFIATRETKGELSYALPLSIALAAFLVMRFVLSQEATNPILFMLLGMVIAMSYRSRLGESANGEAAPVAMHDAHARTSRAT